MEIIQIKTKEDTEKNAFTELKQILDYYDKSKWQIVSFEKRVMLRRTGKSCWFEVFIAEK